MTSSMQLLEELIKSGNLKIVYRTKDIAEALHVNASTAGKMCKSGLIKSRTIGRDSVVSLFELLEFFDVTEGETISTAPGGIEIAAARARQIRQARQQHQAKGGRFMA